MSESREDLGYIKDKPEKALKRVYPPVPIWHHEAEEATADRRARALSAIFKLFHDPLFLEGGLVEVSLDNRRIDFYPASDTYYLHSSQSYGHNIVKLCDEIQAWKEKKASAERS